ncbi:MAG: hypothetical protein ACE14L_17785 [Terriglobales bacterium]
MHRAMRVVLLLGLLMCIGVATGLGEEKKNTAAAGNLQDDVRKLKLLNTLDVPSEVATEFGPPLRCDREGNLYLHSEVFGVSGLRRISPKGERLATFNPNPDSHVKVDFIGSFALGRGDLYALVYAKEITRYLFVYDLDGKYKSTIKLDPGFAWSPNALAVFPSGELFITGRRYVRSRQDEAKILYVPFTGLFKADGTLLKEIALEDDSPLQKLADAGDRRYASPTAPGSNRAISFSQTDVGEDGNVYLMRWTSPAIFYAIAPTGEVVRRFTLDSGDGNMHPFAFHISGNRLAVLFTHPQTGERVMKVSDLEGTEIATYRYSAKTPGESFGAAFACYTTQPERFTFLSTTDKDKLRLIFAEGS